MADDQVNCRVENVSDGSRHLIFTRADTGECVGEIRIAASPQYLVVISQLFSRWVHIQRGLLPTSIRNILNDKNAIHL